MSATWFRAVAMRSSQSSVFGASLIGWHFFHPRGVVVAGVSSHPGKFGFVTLHNLRRFGYKGRIFPVNREGAEVLGETSLREVSEVPVGEADLVFVCTPNKVNETLLRESAARGVRAAFVASGGYGEAGDEGRERERSLGRGTRRA